MRSFRKSPRAFSPNKLFGECAKLREQSIAVESEQLGLLTAIKKPKPATKVTSTLEPTPKTEQAYTEKSILQQQN